MSSGMIQRVNDPPKEARKKALQRQANAALRRIRDRIKGARKRAGQAHFNAGYNWRRRQPPYVTEGGINNPLEIDLGDAKDGFRIADIVPGADASDSGLAKLRYEHAGYGNILVHIKSAKR